MPPQLEIFGKASLAQENDLAGVHAEVLDDVIHRFEDRDVVALDLSPAEQRVFVERFDDFIGLGDDPSAVRVL